MSYNVLITCKVPVQGWRLFLAPQPKLRRAGSRFAKKKSFIAFSLPLRVPLTNKELLANRKVGKVWIIRHDYLWIIAGSVYIPDKNIAQWGRSWGACRYFDLLDSKGSLFKGWEMGVREWAKSAQRQTIETWRRRGKGANERNVITEQKLSKNKLARFAIRQTLHQSS